MSHPNGLSALILAAGNGKRMKSNKPKALCEVLFKPMICWVRDWCRKAGIEDLCVVIAPDGDDVRAFFPEGASFAVQRERLGTGHAVMQAMDFLLAHKDGDVLVLNGDAPFVDDATIRGALDMHRAERCQITVVTADVADPAGYGRIVRSNRSVRAIVEEADADDAAREIREINSGSYWFQTRYLIDALGRLGRDNAQGEYYLTDTVREAARNGARVRAYRSGNADIALGANDRRGLLKLNEIARVRVLDRLMDAGVALLSADGVLISPDVVIGPDTQIYPNVVIRGATRVGAGCVITSGSLIEDSEIGDGVLINHAQVYDSSVADGARIGPFSQLRPKSRIGPGAKIGDFVEVKNSTIGAKTSVAHLTYVGDSDVGSHVNFGCGVVTCNYNGKQKARTRVGDGAFIGCNTNLIAPVSLGERAYTAAGTTVTEDVPDGALAVGRSRQENKPGRAADYLGSPVQPKR